jgi:23S rRNA (cytosine1962-C5)-methyltransferase
MSAYAQVILKSGKERSLNNFHPWLFSGAIKEIKGAVKEGDIVEIYSNHGIYMATGHFHEGSIKVRIFSFEKAQPGYTFWKNKLQKAYDIRLQLGFIDNAKTSAYRLIHAEGDNMPGLIIDIYGNTAVIQSHTVGMHAIKTDICQALQEIYGPSLKAVYDKSADSMSKQSEVLVTNGFLFGNTSGNEVLENGNKFYVNWEEGQKTGFFIDQRVSRELLGNMSHGKKVLNTFAYSGGFSVYALKGGATLVHSVDSSKKAMEWALRNVELNNTTAQHDFFAVDTFDFLKNMKEEYDIIVLDPPAFAKHLSAVDKAAKGYQNLNYESIKRIKPNGILFTYSCSQVIDKGLFRKIVFAAAAQAKRNVRILYQLSQPADHPVSIYHPEGEYLKGLVLHVE